MPKPLFRATESTPASVVRVLELLGDELRVTEIDRPSSPYLARAALPPGAFPKAGDDVVVIETNVGPVVTAVLGLPDPAVVKTAAMADGTCAQVSATGDRLEVLRADGTTLFVYDVNASHGQVTLRSEAIDVHAFAGDLRLRAAGDVLLEGRTVRAQAHLPGAEEGSTFRLDPRQASLAAPGVNIDSPSLRVQAGRVEMRAADLGAAVDRAVVNVRRLESTADVVVQTARNLYQHVHELAQQRAGSLRTIVDDTIQIKAREVITRAVEAFKLRSEKIHLG